MKGKSILLALSGSQQSRFATEVCWNLAKKLESTITAYHVIDSHGAWEFVGHSKPGFLNSSVYLDSYQKLLSNLFELGDELAKAYAREAKLLGVDDVCIVQEGNPINEICRHSSNHKLVVIGHRPAAVHEHPRSQFQRLSVAEALANDCPRPLLIVQDECKEWTSFAITISLDHINEIYINSSLDMAEALGLRPALLCLTGGVHEEKPDDLVKNLRESNKRLADLPIAVTPAEKDIRVSKDQWYAPSNLPFEKEIWDNPLLTIPTRMIGGERLTVLDSPSSMFVRHLTLPSILLWPEEFVYSMGKDMKERQVSAVS